MSERIDRLMQAAGLKETVLNSLERGDSIFVLTDQTLLFQDGGGTRRVTLRDLKRIHSDQDGLLRVETPAGTALTANLLGFDPAAVQSFFAQVRDATARAKQRPLATDSGPVASGPTSETSNVNAQKAVPVSPAVTPAPTPPANNPPGQPTAEPSAGAKWTGSERSAPPPAAPGAASAADAERPAAPVTPSAPFPSAPPARLIVSPVQPVSPTALNAAATATAAGNGLSTAPTPTPAPAPAPATAAPAAPSWKPQEAPVTAQEAPVTVKPVVKAVRTPTVITDPEVLSRPEAAPQADKPHVETAPVQPEPPAAPRVNGTAAGSLASLAAVAGGVSAWVGALKAMSLVMLLATFGMAYFQYDKGQGINGFWTLIAGGMGAVALWALSDLVKLLVALAQAVSAEGGVMDVD